MRLAGCESRLILFAMSTDYFRVSANRSNLMDRRAHEKARLLCGAAPGTVFMVFCRALSRRVA